MSKAQGSPRVTDGADPRPKRRFRGRPDARGARPRAARNARHERRAVAPPSAQAERAAPMPLGGTKKWRNGTRSQAATSRSRSLRAPRRSWRQDETFALRDARAPPLHRSLFRAARGLPLPGVAPTRTLHESRGFPRERVVNARTYPKPARPPRRELSAAVRRHAVPTCTPWWNERNADSRGGRD
jgi:hypothetical protein